MRLISRLTNFKGELFSSTFTFGVSSIVKLGSSLILTRLLSPTAYGVFAILFSILFMVELLSDVGTSDLLIRHHRGGERRFIHTVWTIRLIRSGFNFALLFGLAPVIAHIYEAPELTGALRAFSFWFLIAGMESMSLVLAQRDQRSRIVSYLNLTTSIAMAAVVIGLALVLRNHYALIYGMLFQRALTAGASHFYYRDVGIGLAFDREAIADQFRFARFVLPSSLLTIVLTQYDKVVLLKLFDLSMLGVYGVAGNLVGPVGALIERNAKVVLYARCASYFRSDRATAALRYYRENKLLLMMGVLLSAMVAGLAQPLVKILYDSRYEGAGIMLMAFGLGAFGSTFQNASQNLLVASGRTHVVLVTNLVRLFTIVPATLLGYQLFGFDGFLWGAVAAKLPPTTYLFWEQRRQGLLDVRSEGVRFAWGLGVFAVCLGLSQILLPMIPSNFLRHLFGKP